MTVLVVSIAIRAIALAWSVVLLRRLRDWRMAFLIAMLALMALRQILTLGERTSPAAALPSPASELPGLLVSVLALLAVTFLGRIPTQSRVAERARRASEETHRRSLETLQLIVEGTSSAIGEEFFRRLVKQLASALRVKFAFVSEVAATNPDWVRLLAFWERDGYGENFEYATQGTPCEQVLERGLVIYRSGVQERFPEDQWLREAGVESYLAMPIFDPAGQPMGHLGVMHDAPMEEDRAAESVLRIFAARAGAELQRKRAEEGLRESERRFRTAFDDAPIGIALAGLDGRLLQVNRAFCQMLGYAEEELLAKTFRDFTHPEDLAESERRSKPLFSGQIPSFHLEKRYVQKDGQVVWGALQASVVTDPDGVPLYAVVQIEDITERRRAEENRRRLAEILEATPDFVGIATVDGQVLYRNAAARRLLGMPEGADASEMTIWEAHPEPWNVYLRSEAIPAAIREGSWSGETVFRRRDGSTFPASQVLIAHRTSEGKVTFLSTIARDVSERRALEEQLRQSQKMEAIGSLAGGIAHDFNNLLTAILGHAQILLSDLSQSDPHRVEAEEIRKAGRRAAQLTNQLLAFSRRQVLELRVLDLNEVVREVEAMLRPVIGEDIQLVTHLDPELGQVKADPGQIEQVIMNLAVNARDAMPSGGTLRLETANADPEGGGRRRLAPSASTRCVMLAVSDTGHGMDVETRSRIFEPFFTTKQPGKGTGLGLSTAYGIVKQIGGEIHVESEPGRGTTFRIYLPRIGGKAEIAAPTRTQAAARRSSETVLVAEDEAAVREIVGRVLRAQGYRVWEARDGAAALLIHAEDEHAIDLLLTDVVMPGLSGLDLAQRLRERNPGLRVIYMSGYADNAAVNEAMRQAGGSFLPKPFTPDEVVRKVREVLDRPAESPKT